MAPSIVLNFPTNLSEMFEQVQLAAFGYDASPRCRPFKCGSQAEQKTDAGSSTSQGKAEPTPSTSRAAENESAAYKAEEKTSEDCSFMEMLQNVLEGKNDIATVSGEEGLNITLDAHEFNPNELSVKVVNGSIVVEGKTNENRCELFSRNFKRSYPIPADCDSDKTFSLLSPEGILTVGVPKREIESREAENPTN